MRKHLIFAVLIFLNLAIFAESKKARNALLIANGNYKHLGKLALPVKETRELKKTLETLGFAVTILEDADKGEIEEAVDFFSEVLRKNGGIGFFHYSGHGVQVKGANYLIPVNANIPDESKVRSRSVSVDYIMDSMNADTNIVILDACRNNPLPATSQKSAAKGLVLASYHPKNSIIVYSAQPGNVAQDGVFTPVLTKHLLEKKELGFILRDVRREVSRMTNGQQNPGEYNELIEEVYLAGYATTANQNSAKQKTDANKNQSPKKKAKTNQNSAQQKQTDSKTAEEYFSLGEKEYKAKNYAKAVEYWQKAANLGHSGAFNRLGVCYDVGNGVSKDYKKAFEYYKKSADLGYATGFFNLGLCYEFGHGSGVQKNLSIALEWYKKAAAQGYSSAKYAIERIEGNQ